MGRTIASIFFLLMGLNSCKEEPKKEVVSLQAIVSPAGPNSSLPHLFSNSNITLLSWMETVGDSLTILKYSKLKGDTWETPHEIIDGNDWFVNWADFPAIAENKGNLLSHVLKKSSEGTYSYDVKLNVLPKGESQWRTNLALHSDNTPTEHGFVTLLPYKSDSFFVTWLDGRNTEEKIGEERGAMTIRAVEVSPTGDISSEMELDSRTCDCCQTTATITKKGPVVIYRDRSEDEIRDIYIVRHVAGEWTEPKAIHNDNWKINGCPVNGPKATAMDNTLAIAWFTAANENPKVNVIFSADGGKFFDTPISVSEMNAMGRVDIALLDHDTAIISYMESKKDSAQIKAVKVKRSGEVSKAIKITDLDASRKTGFPQMELVNDKVYFAWTDVDNGHSTIHTAYVPKQAF
ncbi:hypothetical protein [Maribacter halichondriae]|uniref:hypothetical protein n=1 Tax=Maribacter halichondriae TaxID=2980554 RepID=UPI00235A34A7|nr:hypothetical protein [Maribacter sp. Hal144]